MSKKCPDCLNPDGTWENEEELDDVETEEGIDENLKI